MAGFGPPPKPNARRRNADTFGAPGPDEGVSPREARPPDLPTPSKWIRQTREWWAAWTTSPAAGYFAATDWERLKALLPLVDGYHRLVGKAADDPRKLRAAKDILAEIRQNESQLGATHLDRLRGRMSSGQPAGEAAEQPGAQPENLARMEEYRKAF